jgi:hypothetical protein
MVVVRQEVLHRGEPDLTKLLDGANGVPHIVVEVVSKLPKNLVVGDGDPRLNVDSAECLERVD